MGGYVMAVNLDNAREDDSAIKAPVVDRQVVFKDKGYFINEEDDCKGVAIPHEQQIIQANRPEFVQMLKFNAFGSFITTVISAKPHVKLAGKFNLHVFEPTSAGDYRVMIKELLPYLKELAVSEDKEIAGYFTLVLSSFETYGLYSQIYDENIFTPDEAKQLCHDTPRYSQSSLSSTLEFENFILSDTRGVDVFDRVLDNFDQLFDAIVRAACGKPNVVINLDNMISVKVNIADNFYVRNVFLEFVHYMVLVSTNEQSAYQEMYKSFVNDFAARGAVHYVYGGTLFTANQAKELVRQIQSAGWKYGTTAPLRKIIM